MNWTPNEVEKIMNAVTGMTDERIRLLETEDFIWDALDHAWQLKYDELCEWIAFNKEYDPLERWQIIAPCFLSGGDHGHIMGYMADFFAHESEVVPRFSSPP
jgi:hypothetical protein